MPCLPITLKALKPKETDFEPQNLGEHVKRCRLMRRLTQNEAAHLLGVNAWRVLNWEKGKTQPPIESMPAIFRWLGYDPYPEPKNLLERMLAKRRAKGWSAKEAARRLGVDEGTWGAWERGVTFPKGRHQCCLGRSFRRHYQSIIDVKRVRVRALVGSPSRANKSLPGRSLCHIL